MWIVLVKKVLSYGAGMISRPSLVLEVSLSRCRCY